MNKKVLTHFVATVGAVLVLYVLSYAPVTCYAMKQYLSKPETLETVTKVGVFYAPMNWLIWNAPIFGELHSPYLKFWLKRFELYP